MTGLDIIVQLLLGLFTNISSDMISDDTDMCTAVNEIYQKSVDEFNKKYKGLYGGHYENFITRQENIDLIVKNIRCYEHTKTTEMNTESYEGTVTPDDAVQDFMKIFERNLDADPRFFDYIAKRDHFELTREIYKKVSGRSGSIELLDSYVAPTPDFTGRQNDLRQIERSFSAGNNLVVISGQGGMGKSELAKEYSRIHRKDYDLLFRILYRQHKKNNC